MNLEQKLSLIKKNILEIVTPEELRALLEQKSRPTAYVGFEPSGMVHIGQGVICANKIKALTDVGFEVTVLLADWHAFINDKFQGSMENIKACGKYMEDCFLALGVDREKTNFIYASELVRSEDYWEKVIRIAKCFSMARIKRAMTIMGRKEEDAELDTSKLIYPAMQCADIFQLDVDVALGGMDQRKAHMLAREAAEKLNWKKPCAIHTPLLPSLQGTERMESGGKMSKSLPESCIFIHDTEREIENKIKSAYCPQKETAGNPIVEICKWILFEKYETITIRRKGQASIEVGMEKFLSAYAKGEIHPGDMKLCVAQYLSEMLLPVREYFKKKPENLKLMYEMMGK